MKLQSLAVLLLHGSYDHVLTGASSMVDEVEIREVCDFVDFVVTCRRWFIMNEEYWSTVLEVQKCCFTLEIPNEISCNDWIILGDVATVVMYQYL